MSHRIIALLSVIAALVVVGSAAASSGYWHHSAGNYNCEGAPSVGVICKADGYTLMVGRKTVAIFYGESTRPTPVFSCKAYRSMSSCLDVRP